jgi:hypothetical protein
MPAGSRPSTSPTPVRPRGPSCSSLGDDLLVFWEDTVDGFTYTRRQGGSWPAPRQAEFPFATRRYYPELRSDQPAPRFAPTLLAGPGDAVHAFWLDEAGILYHSHVASGAFGDFEAWSEREELAASVAGLGAAADSTGAVYLAYLQNGAAGAAPSGVYVLRLDAGALQWSAPQPLHQSGYYRLVGAGDGQPAGQRRRGHRRRCLGRGAAGTDLAGALGRQGT